MSGRVAIGGAVAQKAHNAGHTWQFLQYLLGFRRLGWEVLLVDSLEHTDPATHERPARRRARRGEASALAALRP